MKYTDFTKFDNNPKCINSFYKDFHIWFFIRFILFTQIENNTLGADRPKIDLKTMLKNTSFLKILRYSFLTLVKRIPLIRKRIIIFSSNVVNMKNGKFYENRLYDFFYRKVKKNALLVEDSYFLEYRLPRKEKVYYSDFIIVLNKLHLFFSIRNKKDFDNISCVIDGIKELFIDFNLENDFWDELKQATYTAFCSFVFQKKIYLKILQKIKPKIVFREDASYGNYQALSWACNKLGIVFAEFQHGYVGIDHIAYNYGDIFLKNEELKNLLPSYYLTFGSFWGSQISHPAKKIPIGFPYLNEKSKQVNNKNLILIISDGDTPNITRFLINCVKEFSIKNNLKIILKLHPLEVSKKKEWYSDYLEGDLFKIKTFEPVYDYIQNARFVIGSSSTVMYETLCFGINPFVYESERTSIREVEMSIFDTFKTKEELLQLMNGIRTLKKIDYTQFFSDKWETAFLDFINGIM